MIALQSPHVEIELSGPIADLARTYAADDLQRFIHKQERDARDQLEGALIPVISFGLFYTFD